MYLDFLILFIQEAKQEQSAKLIIEAAAKTELVSTRDKYGKLMEENTCLSEKIRKLEQCCDEQEKTLNRAKETLSSQKEEIDGLLNQVAETERYVSTCYFYDDI